MAAKKQKCQPRGDYPIGYCRPPAQHRFKRGQSGNPSGQRKCNGHDTILDELKAIAAIKIPVRHGEKSRKLSLISAILFAHGMNGAKGDAKSAALFLNQLQKLRLLEDQTAGDLPAEPQTKSGLSDALLQNVNPSLLSQDEKVELSRLAAAIDRAGNVLALSASEFERVKELVTNGRGNVVPFRGTKS